ncbi:eukaryotic translation initiation factor 2-alpha kinase 1 [Oncorhynchus mykiss]|uniref:eukaryotic translation initiation factor 2-alpha kinase 1 n=1 Tax=Oncorhynchus mykiss TaxID=8022 RepID=UPI0018783E06|nr:eukaryotic translation initiation factor 2-alpha kinase 1 [Oncorhynchus mykiss]
MAGKQYPSIQKFASSITNQLLLGSLLEHLCFVYERDPTRSHMLFKAIGQHLAAKNVLSLLAISEEFSTIRLQYNRGFTELLHSVSTSIFPQVKNKLDGQKYAVKKILINNVSREDYMKVLRGESVIQS